MIRGKGVQAEDRAGTGCQEEEDWHDTVLRKGERCGPCLQIHIRSIQYGQDCEDVVTFLRCRALEQPRKVARVCKET